MKQRTLLLTLGLSALLASTQLGGDDPTPQKAPADSAVAPAGVPLVASPRLGALPADLAEPIQVAPEPPVPSSALFEAGQRMVRVTDPMDLDDLLVEYDVTVLRQPGRSGFALVAGDAAALEALGNDARVGAMMANGRIHGASPGNGRAPDRGSPPASLRHLQWHLDRVAPPTNLPGAASYTVAVLDTGVAYETAVRDGVAYTAAPSLASSPIVAPYDFVNFDEHANDDHQHGTHIASVIASRGMVSGTAPGVGLMPIKVLDQDNMGNEYGLIEGLWHAIDNGADVVNMSLSFAEGYTPSQALLEAIEAAHEAGVVMVAASGNEAVDMVTWPAAHPLVLAVGSSRPDFADPNGYAVSDYSNIGGAVDVLAPGGDLTTDRNGDGLVDGVLAESIHPDDASDVGFWLMAGTSQASAMVSGLAVHLLADGVPSDEVFIMMQDHGHGGDVDEGTGGGSIDFAGADVMTTDKVPATFYVAMVPHLQPVGSDHIRPRAKFTAFKANGRRAWFLDLIVSFRGPDGAIFKQCATLNGVCTLSGNAVPRNDSAGNPIPYAWAITVEAVESESSNKDDIGYRPVPVMTATSALHDVVRAMEADASLDDALLAWSWTSTRDAKLGYVEEAFSVVDSGSGLASIPLGLVMTPNVLGGLGRMTGRTLDVNGIPVDLGVLDVDGSGLASIPLGLRGLRLVTLDGSGLASIPLGLRADHAYGLGSQLFPMDGVGLASIPLGMKSSPLGEKLLDGGWRVDGYAGASALGSSSELGISAAPVGSGSGAGAEPM